MAPSGRRPSRLPPRTIHVRDSKHTDGPRLALAPRAWTTSLSYAVRNEHC
ncbi:DUF397 domain-containing protein [Streptomyces viridochromogenes]